MRRWRGYDGCRVMYHKRWDTVGEVSRSVAKPPVIGKTDLQSRGRTGLSGRHLREQTANSEFANSVRPFLIHSPAGSIPGLERFQPDWNKTRPRPSPVV